MSIAAALPLGFSSLCEVIDLRLENDIELHGLTEKLNNTMPEGIRVLGVAQVDDRAPALQTQVVAAGYKVKAVESGFGSDLKRRVDSVMESESIIRTRRGKEYDLRPLIHELSCNDEATQIHMLLSAKEGATGRPEEVLDVLGIAFDETRIERVRLNFLS
jgi:radical SAM-linked protein